MPAVITRGAFSANAFGFGTSAPKVPIAVTNLGSNNTSSNSITLTLGTNIPVGSLIFIVTGLVNSTGSLQTVTVSDSASNSYIKKQPYLSYFGSNLLNQSQTQVAYCYNCNALSSGNTITAAWSGGDNLSNISAFYAVGIKKTADPLDIQSIGSQIYPLGAGPFTLSSGVASVAGELFVGVTSVNAYTDNQYAQDSINSWVSPPNGQYNPGTARNTVIGGGYKINAGTSALTYAPPYAGYGYNSQGALSIFSFKPL